METSELYKTLNKYLYKLEPTGLDFALSPEVYKSTSGTLSPEDLTSGYLVGNINFVGGYMQSDNFVSGSAGWKLDSNGTLTAVNATLSGTITATAGAIGGFSIGSDYIRDAANSFGLASTVTGGDDVRFWAGDTYANRATADFIVTEAGILTATGATITGTIKTAAGTGQRIVIASADNTLTFYNASNAVVAQMGAGASIGNALRITLDASTTTGVKVTSATANDIGFSFVNAGNYDSTGVNVDLSGATNTGTAINVNHDGSSGEAIFIDTSSAAKGILVQNTGSGENLYLTSTASKTIYINNSSDSHIAIEIDYAGRQEALYIAGSDTNSAKSVIYATAGQAGGEATVQFNKSNYGAVLYLTSSSASDSNYSIGLKTNIASSGTSVEAAFEFAGSEYIAGATSVSGLTGVIKVVTSDGLCYMPVYSGYA